MITCQAYNILCPEGSTDQHYNRSFSREEIAYLMDCADTNKDGLLDYMEFTERFHQPAENIGIV